MIDAILWAAVIIPLLFVFYALAQFSEKLGEALHLKPYHTLYYLASLLLFVSVQMKLLSVISPDIAAISVHLCEVLIASGMTIALMITVRYWGWLFITDH